jgi:hypothetical protein
MSWLWNNGRAEADGKADTDSGADVEGRISHAWQGLSGKAERGVAVMDITDKVAAATGPEGRGVADITVEAVGSVCEGSQSRNSSGVLTCFVLAAAAVEGAGKVPEGLQDGFPSAFAGKQSLRMASVLAGSPWKVMAQKRQAVGARSAELLSCAALAGGEAQEGSRGQRWIVCVTYSFDRCGDASLDVLVCVSGAVGTTKAKGRRVRWNTPEGGGLLV